MSCIFAMLKKWRKPKGKRAKSDEDSPTITTMRKLNEALELLQKKENLLDTKISTELAKARNFMREKNKRAATICLKRKKLYEAQLLQLGNYQLRIQDQMIMLDQASATTETVVVLRDAATEMDRILKQTNITDVDNTMDEINGQMEDMRAIQEALLAPGTSVDIDEDELEAEFEELELKAQMLEPVATPLQQTPQQNRFEQNAEEEQAELVLKKEMAAE